MRTSLVSNGWFPFETSRSHWQISRLAAIKILLANQNIALKPHLSVSHPFRLARCLIWWSNAWDICLFCTKKLLEKCRVWKDYINRGQRYCLTVCLHQNIMLCWSSKCTISYFDDIFQYIQSQVNIKSLTHEIQNILEVKWVSQNSEILQCNRYTGCPCFAQSCLTMRQIVTDWITPGATDCWDKKCFNASMSKLRSVLPPLADETPTITLCHK